MDHSLNSVQGRRYPASIAQGRYRLGGVIAQGGMGVVLRAHDARLDREVAVKRMLPQTDEEDRVRFLREARTAARLRHPHVVAVHDCGIDEQNVPYLVMDLIDGESLAARIAREPITPAEAASIMAAIAEALEAAHAQGILHRDIKPGNILLSSGGPLLTDFGLARRSADPGLTQEGSVIGTPQYMSPEQAQSLELDARSDVYGLGACLYELLGGRPPFAATSAVSILISVVSDEPTPLRALRPDLDPGLAAITHRCLAKDPAARYATAADLAADLRSWLEAKSVGAAPARDRASSWTTRGLVLLACASALALGRLAHRPTEAPTSPRAQAQAVAPTAPVAPTASRSGDALQRALAQRSRGELSAAAATLTAGLTSAGGDVERARLLALRGDLRGEQGDREAQRRDYDRALELDPTLVEVYYRRAEARVDLKEFESALEDLERVLKLDPRHARAYADRANVRTLLKRPAGALEDLEEALRLDPKHPWAWGALGVIRQARGDRKGAMLAFDRAVALGTDEARVRLHRGTLRANVGNRQGALDDFSVVLRLKPKHRRALYNRADLLLIMGRSEAALADLERLAPLAPRWPEMWALRGTAHKRLGRHDQAARELTRALELKAGFPYALRQRAECYERLGKTSEAIADYRELLRLQPDAPQVRRRLRALQQR